MDYYDTYPFTKKKNIFSEVGSRSCSGVMMFLTIENNLSFYLEVTQNNPFKKLSETTMQKLH